MPTDNTRITSEKEFRRRLEALTAEAVRNGITIEGRRECRSITDQYDYDTQFVLVLKRND